MAELRDVRNKWAHQDAFSADDAYRAIDSVHRLLQSMSAPEAVEAARLKLDLLRTSFEQETKKAVQQAALVRCRGLNLSRERARGTAAAMSSSAARVRRRHRGCPAQPGP